MSLPSAIQGAPRPSLLITWYRQGTNTRENLTGTTLSGTIHHSGVDGTRPIAGDLSLVDAPNGVFRWDFDASDVATPGRYTIEFVATYPTGETPAKTFPAGWVVVASQSGA